MHQEDVVRGKLLRTAIAIATTFVLISCSGQAPRTTESAPQSHESASPVGPSFKRSGTLAYIGADGNVWATSPYQDWIRQVTTDATAPPEGQGRSYHRVAWSLDRGLFFAAVTRSGNNARGELFFQQTLDGPSQLVAQNDEHFYIYLYPSPTPYPAPSRCPVLSYLIEEENGVGLHLVAARDHGFRDLRLAVGRPFYLSWSPDAQRILWHTGGALLDNPAAEIGLYDIGQDRRRILPYAPGTFSAPAWSPQGEHWLGVVASRGSDRLQYITPDEVATLARTDRQEVAFAWSPGGRRVAYAVRRSINRASYGPVTIVDLETGSSKQVTRDAFGISGFFWSPDGGRLAYLSRLDLPDAVWMQWRTVDLMNDLDRGFTAFHPSPLMRFMVHSFGQYAQSHRLWSPDGQYLAYADRDDQGVDRVWLVDTQAEKGADPILIDEGSLGIWSWQ